jgi:cytoskeletal protein CcmA (bactofilin family)
MAWNKRSPATAKPGGTYSTFIDEGSEIEGTFRFSGTVLVNGRLHGEIIANDSLIIGEKGVVNASIRASFVQISGEVVGNVYASDRVELCANSRVHGDVDAPVLIVEDGAVFEGNCRMTHTQRSADATPSRDNSVVPLKR